MGTGVFACREFKTGQYVGKIRGTVYDDPSYGSDYCMQLSDTLALEPAAPFRYVNHSCEPNCTLVWFEPESPDHPVEPTLWLEVISPIKPDEELTIDYAWDADCAIPCCCGSASCRGWIVAEEELPKLRARLKRRRTRANDAECTALEPRGRQAR